MTAGARARSLLKHGVMPVVVGGGCLWFSLRKLNVADVWASLYRADKGWLLAAIASVVLVAVAKSVRWWCLYRVHQRPRSWMGTFDALMTSQMLNLLVPVRLGELARMGLMLQEGIPFTTTMSTIVVEKSTDLLAVGILIGLAVPSAMLPTWFPSSAGLLSGAVGGLLLVILILAWLARRRIGHIARKLVGFRSWVPQRWQRRFAAAVDAALDGLGALVDAQSAPWIAVLTVLSWVASVFTMVAMLASFDLPVRWHTAFVLSLALYLSNMVPTPPALVGVVSAVTMVTLGWFGIAEESSAAMGMVLNAVLVGPVTLMGGWSTWRRFSRLTEGTLRQRWRESLGLVRNSRGA